MFLFKFVSSINCIITYLTQQVWKTKFFITIKPLLPPQKMIKTNRRKHKEDRESHRTLLIHLFISVND